MADTLKDKASATYDAARAKVEENVALGKEKATDAARAAKAKASATANRAKQKAEHAAASTRANAKKAADKTAEGVDKNPLAAIAGGLVVGAILAALLPRTARENKLVGNVGSKVRATASKAAKNARETAKEQLDSLGVNADAAKGQLRDLVSKISEAASSAGSAAADSIRKK
jgi:ElaB/YqjD/DUF883 family membrane-anchored ribosome-binding protein